MSEAAGESQVATVGAPEWFVSAVAQEPGRTWHHFEGAQIEALSWGPRGAPGVLLLHGHAGHADWWSFIAPFLANERRVVAMSWSGMGGSDWRDSYSVDQYAREAEFVAQAEGLFVSGERPTFVAHSFGSVPLLRLVDAIGARLNRAVLVDPLLRPTLGPKRGLGHAREHVLRSSREALVPRFRFAPPRECANGFIVDWIARRGIAEIRQPDGSLGYRWSFDPNLWDRLDLCDVAEVLGRAECELALIAGAQSTVVTAAALQFVRSKAPASTPVVSVPDCGHHVLADQPLALIAVLQTLLAPANRRQ